jgi:predicted alpha/beta-hydrolase family hydrolase
MTESVRIEGEGHDPVGGLLDRAVSPWASFVLAHGAGAPMTHEFMATTARGLASRGVTTLRFNFSYTEQGRRRPDPRKRLLAVVASALAAGREHAPDLPLFAGGKSMGGRMTSTYLSEQEVDQVRGLVFFGFPLHRPGAPSRERGEHLAGVAAPMLFIQGTRDALADLTELRACLAEIEDRALLHVIDEADHSFKVPKRTGRTGEDVRAEMLDTAAQWMKDIVGGPAT